MKYQIKAQAGLGIIALDLCDDIGPEACSAKYVRDTLAANPEATLIRIRVNSSGGDVAEGLDIYRALCDHGARVEGYVTGLAASIASVILCACDHVRIAQGAQVMIHNPYVGVQGDAQAHLSAAEQLAAAEKDLVQIYQGRTKQSTEWLVDSMKVETYLDAQAAVAHGFADEIVPVKISAKEILSIDVSRLKAPSDSLLRMVARAKGKGMDPQIAAVLGLGEDATLQDVIEAIMALKESLSSDPEAAPVPEDAASAPSTPSAPVDPSAPKKKPMPPFDDGDDVLAAIKDLPAAMQAKVLGALAKAKKAGEDTARGPLLARVPTSMQAWAQKQDTAVIREFLASAGISEAPATFREAPKASKKREDASQDDAFAAVAKATGQTMAQIKKAHSDLEGNREKIRSIK